MPDSIQDWLMIGSLRMTPANRSCLTVWQLDSWTNKLTREDPNKAHRVLFCCLGQVSKLVKTFRVSLFRKNHTKSETSSGFRIRNSRTVSTTQVIGRFSLSSGMWGDAERAASLQASDPLATLLFQIASPAHIPWGDQRWQEVLHGYDVWVHLEDSNDNDSSNIVIKACESMVKHAAVSSNLAALSLHVTRMLRQLVRDIQKSNPQGSTIVDKTAVFSQRISRVGKARATAGALQLLRLLCHAVVVKSGEDATPDSVLSDALLYRTRGDLPNDQPVAKPLLHSILDLISVVGEDSSNALDTPEVYDTVVLSFHLLFVLCGTQLYQPFVSSFEAPMQEKRVYNVLEEIFVEADSNQAVIDERNFRMLYASTRSSMSQGSSSEHRKHPFVWTPKSVLGACLEWQIHRPNAPVGSIAHYYHAMAMAAVSTKDGQKPGPDGMYESHMVVQAVVPTASDPATTETNDPNAATSHAIQPHRHAGPNVILDATRGAFVLGSSIILLPFRLMRLVFGVIRSQNKHKHHHDGGLVKKFHSSATSRTRSVLWLSDSIVSDLASCLLLLLVNNYRNRSNAFRAQLASLYDTRWEEGTVQMEGLPDLDLPQAQKQDDASISVKDIGEQDGTNPTSKHTGDELAINFETLFGSFGKILHTEIGSLLLYTMWQTCPTFSQNLVVRSDLDNLVLPLLRTLYFASSSISYTATNASSSRKNQKERPGTVTFNLRSCPFRSQSQLYVNAILLLLFSQDSSFGRDAFRRITVTRVLWYKERNLRNINLGSVFVLTVLRSLMFNLQRMQDSFLLSNCCAILQNIAPAIVDLHDYAAMRLASVTVSVVKKHAKLKQIEDASSEGDYAETNGIAPVEMYEEVARTLLEIIQHCVSAKNINRNLHLVYALVYHQVDLSRLWNGEKLYPSKVIKRIKNVVQEASAIVQEEGARTASIALNVLEDEVERLQGTAEKKKGKHSDEITFAYEEEADPEVFFVPYIWETIVSIVTSGSIEWKEDKIKVFPLLEPLPEGGVPNVTNSETPADTGTFSKDVDEVV